MRILIPLFSPPTGTWGGLTRVLAITQAAREDGHKVAFCASGSLAAILQERGFTVYTAPAATMLGLPQFISRQIEKRSATVNIPVKPGKEVGNFWFVLALSGLANAKYLSELVQAQLLAADQFKPDLLFTDADPGAYISAAISGLPVAGNYASVMRRGPDSIAHHWMEKAAETVLKKYEKSGISLDSLYFGKQVLKIIPSIPELEDITEAASDICFVGSLLGEIQPSQSPNEFKTGRRYVFTYLGTGSLSLDTAKEILPLVFPESGKLHCLVGGSNISHAFQIGAVEFRPYLPAELLLPFCDWTLCHGGQNSIIQSLRSGVPLLLFPGPIFERRFNARKVVAAGAGFMGEVNQFTSDWFNGVLIQQEAAAIHARRLAHNISSLGGARAAVSVMEKWVNHPVN
jgi:UDP:flavonoid glycosyltransferase YjiC (YdhE family)